VATTQRTRSSIWWFLLLAVCVYTITSVCVAVATADACGRLNDDKTWQFFPPAWECPAQRLPGEG
jgi:hypothetical protein